MMNKFYEAHSLLRIRPAPINDLEYRVSRTRLHCYRSSTHCVYHRRGSDARIQETLG